MLVHGNYKEVEVFRCLAEEEDEEVSFISVRGTKDRIVSNCMHANVLSVEE